MSRYEERFYREIMQAGNLTGFTVRAGESDLRIFAGGDFSSEAEKAVREIREIISGHGRKYSGFFASHVPLNSPPDEIHFCLASMYEAAQQAGVGPMAAVAGAVNHFVAGKLELFSEEYILENGGDLLIKSVSPRKIMIYAGTSPFSGKIGLELPAGRRAVCTSAGTLGHSFSYGRADAAVIVSENSFLADAAATGMGNRVKTAEDIGPALEYALAMEGVEGALVIAGDRMGSRGKINLIGL